MQPGQAITSDGTLDQLVLDGPEDSQAEHPLEPVLAPEEINTSISMH